MVLWIRLFVLVIGISGKRAADSEDMAANRLSTEEKTSINQAQEELTTEAGNDDEPTMMPGVPQAPQNRDYADYEEEKRQDQEIDSKEPSFNEPDEFKNVISPDSGDLSSLQYFGAIILAFTLASVVIFYVWRWRAQRTNNRLYEPTASSFNNPISFPGTRYSDDSTQL
ncbi:Oidioi.mRNA.OKI2018_I69.PAR.g10389.t1.cds [Oikopleura dioica]|uniref:Oidioi.mRNA.OKI2018_I69.PAR.g10389.t1.cds n=1 Tax=Oikopleura dioica TaxID=34765 RepID=A0ABN7RY11_OIKDI|nr:Oidioi.mRNA.OKI2018_I69.PAR.g10389.t1.cds [Oikopleura dioica]